MDKGGRQRVAHPHLIERTLWFGFGVTARHNCSLGNGSLIGTSDTRVKRRTLRQEEK